MICQECKERPASLHFTKVVNGEKTVIQLCERCAQEKGEMFLLEGGAGFSINDLLAGLLNPSSFQNASPHTALGSQIVQCDVCGMTYQQFANIGRFGCANCYNAFRKELIPILKKLHSGNIAHGGKVPARMGGSLHLKKKIQECKSELAALIEQEEFEKAAEVRDQIRSLEKKLAEGEEKME
ncbi:UvrB/UvrC motif-containing protein [Siminovitchia fortis]|uniref:UvrB/UvrC motif-containing protein n=1 Tax=Siminovitchia fortis TaxID=254758 RepID=UPI0011A2636D|nr:UvrB/UvrC motif-containing protein [Siminovitchia fortis]